MSLNDFVVDALEHETRFKGEQFWTVENHHKYSTLQMDRPDGIGQSTINHQIFLLMCGLNQQGVGDQCLCSNQYGRGSLRSVIDALGYRLSLLCKDRHVHYVELGPEPIKTACLLDDVVDVSDTLRYTAIDINETSKATMHDVVEPIVASRGSFHYIAADFHSVTAQCLNHGQDITLITMLGFQEGNELPVTTGRLIRNLSAQSTYIISEMQLYGEGLEEHIHRFYAHPNMVRFSELVAQQQGFHSSGTHQSEIVRIKIFDEVLHVAVTLQPVEHNGLEGYLLSNICIKYTAEQFKRIRVAHGNCLVVDEFTSGDGSVAYQLAQYQPQQHQGARRAA